MVKTASATPLGYTYIWDKPGKWVKYKDKDFCCQEHLAKDILKIPMVDDPINIDKILESAFKEDGAL
jgi:hypothetical protein